MKHDIVSGLKTILPEFEQYYSAYPWVFEEKVIEKLDQHLAPYCSQNSDKNSYLDALNKMFTNPTNITRIISKLNKKISAIKRAEQEFSSIPGNCYLELDEKNDYLKKLVEHFLKLPVDEHDSGDVQLKIIECKQNLRLLINNKIATKILKELAEKEPFFAKLIEDSFSFNAIQDDLIQELEKRRSSHNELDLGMLNEQEIIQDIVESNIKKITLLRQAKVTWVRECIGDNGRQVYSTAVFDKFILELLLLENKIQVFERELQQVEQERQAGLVATENATDLLLTKEAIIRSLSLTNDKKQELIKSFFQPIVIEKLLEAARVRTNKELNSSDSSVLQVEIKTKKELIAQIINTVIELQIVSNKQLTQATLKLKKHLLQQIAEYTLSITKKTEQAIEHSFTDLRSSTRKYNFYKFGYSLLLRSKLLKKLLLKFKLFNGVYKPTDRLKRLFHKYYDGKISGLSLQKLFVMLKKQIELATTLNNKQELRFLNKLLIDLQTSHNPNALRYALTTWQEMMQQKLINNGKKYLNYILQSNEDIAKLLCDATHDTDHQILANLLLANSSEDNDSCKQKYLSMLADSMYLKEFTKKMEASSMPEEQVASQRVVSSDVSLALAGREGSPELSLSQPQPSLVLPKYDSDRSSSDSVGNSDSSARIANSSSRRSLSSSLTP